LVDGNTNTGTASGLDDDGISLGLGVGDGDISFGGVGGDRGDSGAGSGVSDGVEVDGKVCVGTDSTPFSCISAIKSAFGLITFSLDL
jgi:hypothetical protein